MTTAARRSVSPPAGVARLLAGSGRLPTLDHHLALYGPLEHRPGLADLAASADLRGRGGSGFPTATKLSAVTSRRGRAVVVANGVEGEPTSKKDHSLLRVAPHLVLDGAAAAAHAVGAQEAIIAVSRPAHELRTAIAERERRQIDEVVFEVRSVPPLFVAGEETALLRAIAGKPARPTLKPPFPFERGVGGAPTLVQNVETLAHLALVARFGPEWFGRGTALVTLGGAVNRPGVHEIPLGTTLARAIDACGGISTTVSAYLVGGYFGRWITVADADTLELTNANLGAGAIVALPDATCAVAECARVVRYLAAESAGQCGPCVHGLTALADALAVDQRGDSRPELARLSRLVTGRGACRHPDGAAGFVESALQVFADEFARHARHRSCGRRAHGILPVSQEALR